MLAVMAAAGPSGGDLDEEEDEFASVNSVLLTSTLLALIWIGYRINTNRLRHIPESGVAIILGFLLGVLVRLAGIKEEISLMQFNSSLFFYVLLPPIILEAGLSLQTQMFVDNLGAICTFAVMGTLISTWVISKALYLGAKSGLLGLDGDSQRLAIHCHLFGALISATDPVATIALFGGSRFRSDPLLHSLINGESVLNDAVAIALFSTLSNHLNEENPHLFSFSVLGSFFMVSAFSLVLGLAAGAFCSWCFCRSRFLSSFPEYEVSAMCLSAYLTFAWAQLLGLSGIVALFFFGVMLAQYNYYNLSDRSKVASQVTFGTMAKLAEGCVFVYLGIVCALSLNKFHWHIGLVIYSCIVITIARAAHIFPLTGLLNMWRAKKISKKMTVVLWVSGLRGAVAFALSLRLPCKEGVEVVRGAEQCKNSDMLVTTTISVVMLTTLVVGTTMETFMTSMGVLEIVPAGSGGSPLGSGGAGRDRTLSGGGDESAGSRLSVPLAQYGAANPSRSSANVRENPSAGSFSETASDVSNDDSASRSSSMDSWQHNDRHAERGLPLGSSASSARTLLNARGWLYQAFARFDVNYLQPALGGPCRSRGRGGDAGAGGEIVELPSLNSFLANTPAAELPSLDFSRATVFE